MSETKYTADQIKALMKRIRFSEKRKQKNTQSIKA